jgi:hypothetical protein
MLSPKQTSRGRSAALAGAPSSPQASNNTAIETTRLRDTYTSLV